MSTKTFLTTTAVLFTLTLAFLCTILEGRNLQRQSFNGPWGNHGPRHLTGKGCDAPKAVGMCKATVPSYYYNSKSGKCQRFTYGGCGGNANRFDTQQECEEKCMRKGTYR